MAFSGGVYTLPTPALVPGQIVSSSENNTVRNDMAASFNLTMLRNGTSTATANLPMGGYKLTGLGAATTNGDALSYGAAAVVTTLTSTSLTATRVPYAGTGGLLQDASTFTFDGTTLTAGGFTTSGAISAGTITASGTITVSGGTANGVAYLNGSKVLTTGSAMTFDGTNFATTGSVTSAGASNSGNLTFTGTGNRITGDFSNATVANRVAFQTSTTNTSTIITALPNGSGASAGINIFNNSDPTNAAFGGILVTNTDFQLRTLITGTGTYLPMTFYTGGSERMRIDTSGNVGIGITNAATALHIYRTAADAIGTFQGLQTSSGGTGKGGVQLDVNGKGGYAILCDATSGTRALTFNGNSGYGISTAEYMRIDSSGNVGIGTSSPNGAANYGWLTVNGSSGSVVSVSVGNTEYGRLVGGSSGTYVSALNSAPLVVQTTTAQPFIVQTNNTERMRIDSSGNVGIGTSSPGNNGKLSVVALSGGDCVSMIGRNADGYARFQAWDRSATTKTGSLAFIEDGTITFNRSNTGSQVENMRIDSSGNLLIGKTSTSNSVAGTYFTQAGGDGSPAYQFGAKTFNGTRNYLLLYSSGTYTGGIDFSNTTTAFVTSSDYRLKENIQPMTNALSVVSQLKPVTYTWKADGSDGQGFIAHELQAVVPDCVTGEKDAVDAEGNPVYQGIDTSFLVATLTKAIQELNEKVTQQAAEIAALKGA